MPSLPHSGNHCCCFPLLLPLQSGTSPSQLLPSTAGVCDAAVGMGRAATLLSNVETWFAGTKFLNSNHLPTSHPPHSISLELQPSSWETPNCSLNSCSKQPPSHNSQNTTSFPFHLSKCRILIQDGTCYLLINTVTSTELSSAWPQHCKIPPSKSALTLHHFCFTHFFPPTYPFPSAPLQKAVLSCSHKQPNTFPHMQLSLRHLSQCMWHKTNFRNIF